MVIMGICPTTKQKFDTGLDLDDKAMTVDFEAWCEACGRMHTGTVSKGKAKLGKARPDKDD